MPRLPFLTPPKVDFLPDDDQPITRREANLLLKVMRSDQRWWGLMLVAGAGVISRIDVPAELTGVAAAALVVKIIFFSS